MRQGTSRGHIVLLLRAAVTSVCPRILFATHSDKGRCRSRWPGEAWCPWFLKIEEKVVSLVFR